jgi:hypothetical protein
MLAYLQKGREKEFGWLCKEETEASNTQVEKGIKCVYLDPDEKDLLVKILLLHSTILNLETTIIQVFPAKDLAHAFGVSVDVINALFQINSTTSTQTSANNAQTRSRH